MKNKLTKKMLSLFLMLCLFAQMFGGGMFKPTYALDNVQLQDETIYMTLDKTFQDVAIGVTEDLSKFKWTYDDQPIEEVKTWLLTPNAGGGFKGDNYITVNGNLQADGLHLDITFKSLFGRDLSERTKFGNIRRAYQAQVGEHILKGVSDTGTTITKKINLRPYEGYRSYDEMVAEVETIVGTPGTDRIINLETIGTSANGRPIKMAVVAKNQEAIDNYLNNTMPKMLYEPDEALEMLNNGTLNGQVPILFNNTHADEQPGIDIVIELFKKFATENAINYQTTNADGSPKTVNLNVNNLLDKFIFLFDFTENPDGYVLNTRALANSLDPNRDAGYQTNPETRAIVEQINKWNPISLLDFHGFVKSFLIEPATPPHDINFEYDLISENILNEAHQMGRAGVANSEYTSYFIPKVGWSDGWDDNFSGYTGVYALYHGILGHTVEVPEGNEESYKAGIYAGLGAVEFAEENLNSILTKKITFFSRGVNKIEDPHAEDELVNANGDRIGRPKHESGKFFPDYYVIPMDVTNDKSMQAAFDMVEYLNRNGIAVKELKEDVGEYKKGDLIVDMAQPKRGYANHVLYKGVNLSDWGGMYAEVVMDFPTMRDFKSIPVYEANKFDNKLGDVTRTEAPRSATDSKASHYKVANSSIEAIQAVNAAIAAGKDVYLTDDGFIMDAATFTEVSEKFALYAEPLIDKKVEGEPIKSLKIYAPKHDYGWPGVPLTTDTENALAPLGFIFVETPEEADIYIFESNQFDESLLGDKPTMIIGGDASRHLEDLGVVNGYDSEATGESHEGLVKANVIDDKHVLTSGYNTNDLFYTTSGTWIKGVPSGFNPLLKVQDNDYYIAGWWPGNDAVAGKIVAAEGKYNGVDMMIYTGNPTNKTHTHNFYRWVSNFIYRGQLAKITDIEKPVTPATPVTPLPALGASDGMFKVSALVIACAGVTLLLKPTKKEN